MIKNTNAINKIIAELSRRDYISQWSKLTKAQKDRARTGKSSFSYSLGADTLDAIKVKNDYIFGVMSENDYKFFCLKYNLLNA